MKLYLIRHAERGHGAKQDTLTKEGLLQAKKLAEYLKNLKINKIICGTTNRAKKTAKPIIHYFDNVEIEYTNEISEQNLGELQGKTANEWRDVVIKSGLSEEEFKPKGGENIVDAYQRAKKFVEKLKSEKEKNILIFSHSGFISNILTILLKKSQEENINYKTDFCTLTYLELDKNFNVLKFKFNKKIID